MERFLTEYLVNSIWQVPLLVAGAWLTVRVVRPRPRAQHWIWVGLLPLMLATPLLTLDGSKGSPAVQAPLLTAPPASGDSPAGMLQSPASLLAGAQMQSPDLASDPSPAPPQAGPSLNGADGRASRRPIREMTLSPSVTHWLVALYLAAFAFTAMRLLCSGWAAGRLLARAEPALLSDAASDLLDQCCGRFKVAQPKVLLSSSTSGPMLVGILRPSLLLPRKFRDRLQDIAGSDRELEAIWLHELAHLRRRDYLANLVCRVAALPIAYHPATFVVQQRIRQTREMLCDAIAAAEMQSPLSYARCLVALARNMQDGGMAVQTAAVGMFDSTVLEERIMQLIQLKPATSVWTRIIRLAGGAAVMLAAMATPAIFHLTPMMAQVTELTSPGTAAGAAVPAANAAPTPSPVQAQTAPSAIPAVPGAPADRKAEVKKKAAEAKAANVQSKAASVESRKQMEDARKRLDYAAKAWSDLAAKSAKPGAEADTPDFKQRMDTARKQLDEATEAWNDIVAKTVDSTIREKEARINSAQFERQLAEAAARVNNPEFKKQIADAQDRFNSPEFKAQMDKLNKQMADAQVKFNNPEFKKQIADAQAKFDSPEFKEQMDKLKKQIADAQAKFNSPEFREKMEKFNSPEFNEPFQSQILRSQMWEIRQEIDDALKAWSAIENAPAK